MDAKEIKQKMYNTPWLIESDDTEVGNSDFVILELMDNGAHIDMTNVSANSHAIVSAINGTYAKGINPEKVEEMYDALVKVEMLLRNEGFKHSSEALQIIINSAKL